MWVNGINPVSCSCRTLKFSLPKILLFFSGQSSLFYLVELNNKRKRKIIIKLMFQSKTSSCTLFLLFSLTFLRNDHFTLSMPSRRLSLCSSQSSMKKFFFIIITFHDFLKSSTTQGDRRINYRYQTNEATQTSHEFFTS